MKAVKENDLKRIFGEVMFNEFIAYMKGRTFINSTTEHMYYSDNICNFLIHFFNGNKVEIIIKYSRELEKVEIELEGIE